MEEGLGSLSTISQVNLQCTRLLNILQSLFFFKRCSPLFSIKYVTTYISYMSQETFFFWLQNGGSLFLLAETTVTQGAVPSVFHNLKNSVINILPFSSTSHICQCSFLSNAVQLLLSQIVGGLIYLLVFLLAVWPYYSHGSSCSNYLII